MFYSSGRWTRDVSPRNHMAPGRGPILHWEFWGAAAEVKLQFWCAPKLQRMTAYKILTWHRDRKKSRYVEPYYLLASLGVDISKIFKIYDFLSRKIMDNFIIPNHLYLNVTQLLFLFRLILLLSTHDTSPFFTSICGRVFLGQSWFNLWWELPCLKEPSFLRSSRGGSNQRTPIRCAGIRSPQKSPTNWYPKMTQNLRKPGHRFFLLGQWLNFKLLGIPYLVGKIKFKLFFQGPLAKWVRLSKKRPIHFLLRPGIQPAVHFSGLCTSSRTWKSTASLWHPWRFPSWVGKMIRFASWKFGKVWAVLRGVVGLAVSY